MSPTGDPKGGPCGDRNGLLEPPVGPQAAQSDPVVLQAQEGDSNHDEQDGPHATCKCNKAAVRSPLSPATWQLRQGEEGSGTCDCLAEECDT